VEEAAVEVEEAAVEVEEEEEEEEDDDDEACSWIPLHTKTHLADEWMEQNAPGVKTSST
jgi:hypothetical protein